MSSQEKLPDTSGYSYDDAPLPWERLDFRKQLRIVPHDRSAAIKYTIDWIYSSKEFEENTDYYAAGAWAVLAHGLASQNHGLPTSDWIYDDPAKWKNVGCVTRDRVNRALLKFPIATDMIVASKASWWCWERRLTQADESMLEPLRGSLPTKDFVKIANVIGQWASTRKVLSSAGIKGMLEESDVFAGVAQTLRIRDELKPYFSHPPSGWNFPFRSLLDPRILLLLKYWPAAEEISSLLHVLQDFQANREYYHERSTFLTGRSRKSSKLNVIYEKIDNVHELLSADPNLPHFKTIFQQLSVEFDEDFLKEFIRFSKAGRTEEFFACRATAVKDDIVEAIIMLVNKINA